MSATLECGMSGVSHILMVSQANMMALRPEILPKLTNHDWIKEQELDVDIHKVVDLVKWNLHL